MSIELHADEATEGEGPAPFPSSGQDRRMRPHVPGDLASVLQAGPMFRRAISGYDRFEVETYVQWAEGELAAADRERERLLGRQLDTAAALAEARELLSHSSDGSRFVELSRSMGTLLATAADEAEAVRAAADADARAVAAEAQRTATEAAQTLSVARAAAAATTEDAVRALADARAAADALVEQARRTDAEAYEHLANARTVEQRAAAEADRLREAAAEEATAARLQARDQIVGMLAVGREERRRADADAAAVRERLDTEASAARAGLLAEVAALEERLAALRAQDEQPAAPAGDVVADPPRQHARSLLDRVTRPAWTAVRRPGEPSRP
jgi:hypothetical protein